MRDLAWVMTGPALLAVAHAQGTLLLRDPRGVLGAPVSWTVGNRGPALYTLASPPALDLWSPRQACKRQNGCRGASLHAHRSWGSCEAKRACCGQRVSSLGPAQLRGMPAWDWDVSSILRCCLANHRVELRMAGRPSWLTAAGVRGVCPVNPVKGPSGAGLSPISRLGMGEACTAAALQSGSGGCWHESWV